MTDNVGQSRESARGISSLGSRPVQPPGARAIAAAPVEEVSLRELNRNTGRLIEVAEDGTRLILTRHATPVAVVLSVADFVDVVEPPVLERPLPTVATIRRRLRETLAEVLGDDVLRNLRRREISRMLHGRWH